MNEQSITRSKMPIATFLFMSIAGAGFVLKSVAQQFSSLGTYTLIMYLACIVIYAIPFTMMIVEFSSLKKTIGSESGYQSWMSLILGRKLGFMAGFFYFFVNLFFFLDTIPNLVLFIIFLIGGNQGGNWIITLEKYQWFKPILTLMAILIFWIGTYVSMKGPKWLGKITAFGGYAGMIMTVLFILGTFVFLVNGGVLGNPNGGDLKIFDENGKQVSILSWSKIASVAWALQTLGGLEAMASYKNDFEGGQRGFKKVMILNLIIFASILMVTAIMMQLAVPADQASKWGLAEIIYKCYQVIGLPSWWTHVVGGILAIATVSSIMFWTAAPVKVLFGDAPQGIFGKWLSKTSKKDGTPVNGLIFQGIIVTILFSISIVASLNSGMNTFLTVLKNLNGGSATIPILFMVCAYYKMRLKSDEYERDYYFLGKSKWAGILATIPLGLLFAITTFFALIPSPETFNTDLVGALLTLILGPTGIITAFIFCEIAFRKWKKKNPNDTSVFNISESNKGLIESAEREIKNEKI